MIKRAGFIRSRACKKKMEDYFRLEVLGMLKKEGLISEDLIGNLLSWKNSGFSVYSEGKVVANDDA